MKTYKQYEEARVKKGGGRHGGRFVVGKDDLEKIEKKTQASIQKDADARQKDHDKAAKKKAEDEDKAEVEARKTDK